MLREAISASNDAACPEHGEVLDAYGNLGAELADAPPEVRAAAVVRSRRLPEPSVMRAAWYSLTATDQNRIGTAAITQSFYSHLGAQSHLPLTLEAGKLAESLDHQALNEVEAIAKAALPALYGTDGAEPAWALSDAPLSFPDPLPSLAPTKMPPRVHTEAVARSRRVPGLDAIMAAWSRLPPATQDLLGVQAVACAFYGWLTDDNDQAPADRWLTDRAVGQCVHRGDKALQLMAEIAERSLPELYGTKKRDPAWADLDADPAALDALWEAALPSPAQSAIALHKAAWRALQARAAFVKTTEDMQERWALGWSEEQGEDEALMDLLLVSCRDRADAEAMAAHLGWYLRARALHPKRPAMGGSDAALIAVRLRDLARTLERDVAGAAPLAVPGAMASSIAEHKAAWNAYLADPDAEATDWDQHHSMADAAGAAAEGILLAPCADLAEAAAFVAHVAWYATELEAAGDSLSDGFGYEAQQMRARAGDLAVWIGDGAAVSAARALPAE